MVMADSTAGGGGSLAGSTGREANAARDTTLVPVPKALKEMTPATGDTIGFVFPVYIFGMPKIMVNFVEQLAIPKDAYVFAVALGIPYIARLVRYPAAAWHEKDRRIAALKAQHGLRNITEFWQTHINVS